MTKLDPATVEACAQEAFSWEIDWRLGIAENLVKLGLAIRSLATRPPEPCPHGNRYEDCCWAGRPPELPPPRTLYQYYVDHGCWRTIRSDAAVTENADGSITCVAAEGVSTFASGCWRVSLVPRAEPTPLQQVADAVEADRVSRGTK